MNYDVQLAAFDDQLREAEQRRAEKLEVLKRAWAVAQEARRKQDDYYEKSKKAQRKSDESARAFYCVRTQTSTRIKRLESNPNKTAKEVVELTELKRKLQSAKSNFKNDLNTYNQLRAVFEQRRSAYLDAKQAYQSARLEYLQAKKLIGRIRFERQLCVDQIASQSHAAMAMVE